MKSVSVIIPTWNRADLIRKAITSALEQTVPVLEVLVCDDGSTDGTEEVVRSIKDERVVWLGGSRGGRPAIPRNRGIAASKGEWLAFLDSDDEWLPDKLEKQLALAAEMQCRAACSNAHNFVPGKGITGDFLTWQGTRINFDDLLPVNLVICSTTLIHRSLIEWVIGFPEDENLKVGEDYSLWLRVASQSDFSFVPEPLVIYRNDAANSARSDLFDEKLVRVDVFKNFITWSRDRKVPLVLKQKAGVQAVRDYLWSRSHAVFSPIMRKVRRARNFL